MATEKTTGFALKRDGCWLAEYRDTGIREFVDGVLTVVPTGIYTSDIRYAKVFETALTAEVIGKRLGAKVMVIG